MPSNQPVSQSSSQDVPRVTGWPSPAEQYMETLDLHRALIHHPRATYLLRVADASMTPRIHPGDIAVIDRACAPRHHDVVAIQHGADFSLKRSQRRGAPVRLVPDNPGFDSIELTQEFDVVVWGVVTYVIAQPRVR